MLTTLARRDRENRGFTLVELAGVILVIAILAAIAIPVFQIFQQRSRGSSMDATADNYITSLVALAQQAGRSANDGRDLADAYAEIPADSQAGIGVDAWDGSAWVDVAALGNDDYTSLRIVQRFGDNVRGGCLYLPSAEAAGEEPVYVRHGSTYEGNDVDWDGTGPHLNNGDTADVTADDCGALDITPAAEEEGVYDETGDFAEMDPATAAPSSQVQFNDD